VDTNTKLHRIYGRREVLGTTWHVGMAKRSADTAHAVVYGMTEGQQLLEGWSL
jgi:hypothetical protein